MVAFRRHLPKALEHVSVLLLCAAMLVSQMLLTFFAVQHSVMARKPFKRWWTQFVPASVERSTYVLFASLALVLLFWQWRPLPGVMWQVADPQIAAAITGLAFLGLLLVLTSTFLINHFDLFGLHQGVNNLNGRALPQPQLRTPVLYG